MCIGPFKPKTPAPPPPPAPPPAQTPATAMDVDFDAVSTSSDKLKDKAKGKSGLRNDPKQNALGSDLSKGTGLNIPTKPKS